MDVVVSRHSSPWPRYPLPRMRPPRFTSHLDGHALLHGSGGILDVLADVLAPLKLK